MSFKDRTLTQTITEEFIEQGTDVPNMKAREVIEDMAKRFEKSFAAVAEVTTPNRMRGRAYEIRVIPKREADYKEVKRGMDSIMYWLSEYEN